MSSTKRQHSRIIWYPRLLSLVSLVLITRKKWAAKGSKFSRWERSCTSLLVGMPQLRHFSYCITASATILFISLHNQPFDRWSSRNHSHCRKYWLGPWLSLSMEVTPQASSPRLKKFQVGTSWTVKSGGLETLRFRTTYLFGRVIWLRKAKFNASYSKKVLKALRQQRSRIKLPSELFRTPTLRWQTSSFQTRRGLS